MSPLTPHWHQPSHPAIQRVVINSAEFTSKSLSKVALPPFAVYAKLDFPPCTVAQDPTYATVQIGKHSHLNLNSDLLYINHSCEPSLIFDTASMNILVGPRGLQPGDELTFFYPSTEWHMAQPFTCLCGHASCRGTISGAKDMPPQQLQGVWLNEHIRELLDDEQRGAHSSPAAADPTAQALAAALLQAEKVVEVTRLALRTYASTLSPRHSPGLLPNGKANGFAASNDLAAAEGLNRRGPTSRELSGEMGGDTVGL
ncbi:uncharacterized protein UV8b_00714 [Ustilaginoidea virens]|uniref:Post-SET domain-containing protein n=1 Tax=Ustilaginoidea virens TaxID=1159556 RepID=A0A8E5MDP7_USTVR|nr:uncharacterized protein UV8b_00714 [Ustilaginoidea virens]QUC16473.1 hypothetical protein UV8b_00714 [Ustilaginoidea virens]